MGLKKAKCRNTITPKTTDIISLTGKSDVFMTKEFNVIKIKYTNAISKMYNMVDILFIFHLFINSS